MPSANFIESESEHNGRRSGPPPNYSYFGLEISLIVRFRLGFRSGAENTPSQNRHADKFRRYVARPDRAAFTRAGVKGALRNLAPVASNTALPSAAATTAAAASP